MSIIPPNICQLLPSQVLEPLRIKNVYLGKNKIMVFVDYNINLRTLTATDSIGGFRLYG